MMNSIGFKDPVQVALSTSDPFNYPMPSRDLCMSMNTITTHNDHVQTKTGRFKSERRSSMNLSSADIEGKPKTTLIAL